MPISSLTMVCDSAWGLSATVHVCLVRLSCLFVYLMRYTQKWGRPGLKYHVRIVGGAILLLFPEARSPSHVVEELLASHIICTTYGLLSIWLLRGSGDLYVKPHPFTSLP